jgi:hypothetical protein
MFCLVSTVSSKEAPPRFPHRNLIDRDALFTELSFVGFPESLENELLSRSIMEPL